MDQPGPRNPLPFLTIKNSDGLESVHYPAFYEGVPDECQKFAESELGETPEMVSRGINYLTRFLAEKGLPKTEERHLLAVLRNCKHDLKKSRKKLERFLEGRALIAERVAAFDFDKVDKIVRSKACTFLPFRDKHARLIVVTRPVVREEPMIKEGFICFMAMLLYILEFPMTSMFGVAYIAESKTPSVLQSQLFAQLKEYKSWLLTLFNLPLGPRKIDVTNESIVQRWFMHIARPITPAKIFKRISMHGDNMESLKKLYHPDLLPDIFKGNAGPISSEHYHEKFQDFLKKLRDEHLAKVATKS